MKSEFQAKQVIPRALAESVDDLDFWFVIGGHAVRCFRPYRPSRDVDFGVLTANELEQLLSELDRRGRTEILERSDDTVHLLWNQINVSIFVLDNLAPHVEAQRLTVAGILATKMHAILDRGLRRDFFDLYVIMNEQRLGLAECLRAMRHVYQQEINDALLLRALTYFDDAEQEAQLPGEGPRDWKTVKAFFLERVGNLLVPPGKTLQIQRRTVDVDGE